MSFARSAQLLAHGPDCRQLRWFSKAVKREAGQALMVVLGVMLVVTLIPLAVVETTTARVPLTIQAKNSQLAIAAMQAGMQDYMAHFDANPAYAAEYNQSDGYSFDGHSSSNQAFSQWVQVPAAQGGSRPNEWYTYRVAWNSQSPSDATVYVAGCGGVYPGPKGACGTNDLSSVSVESREVISASPFHDAYFTKYQLNDPGDPNNYMQRTGCGPLDLYGCKYTQTYDSYQSYEIGQAAKDYCDYFGTQPNPENGNQPGPVLTSKLSLSIPSLGQVSQAACIPNYFFHQHFNGPVASDDNFFFCGSPQFTGPVYSYDTAYDNGLGYRELSHSLDWLFISQTNLNCTGSPQFDVSSNPNGATLYMPEQHLPKLTSWESAAQAGGPDYGCYYEGQTSIIFHANGTMTVSSPNSVAKSNGGLTNDQCLANPSEPGIPGRVSMPANGAIFVGNVGGNAQQAAASDSCLPALGPNPPVVNPDPSNSGSPQGYGPPTLEVGINPPQGNGFSGVWEPPYKGGGFHGYALSSEPIKIDGRHGLIWQTRQSPCLGDLFLQGTAAKSVSVAASWNVYLTGSVCVPQDHNCRDTNREWNGSHTSVRGQGNGYVASTSLPSSLRSSPVSIGIIAGNLIETYNPSLQASFNDNPLSWNWSLHVHLLHWCQGILGIPHPCLYNHEYAYLEVQGSFSGPPMALSANGQSLSWNAAWTEGNLEGYPHRYVIVDAAIEDYNGGITTQNLVVNKMAGNNGSQMGNPDPFAHILSGHQHSMAGLVVNGSMVARYAPNTNCRVVSGFLGWLANLTNSSLSGCQRYVDLELPDIGLHVSAVLNLVNFDECLVPLAGCPSAQSPSILPDQDSGWWGPLHLTNSYGIPGLFTVSVIAYMYQEQLTSKRGYEAYFNYNPALTTKLPSYFPQPSVDEGSLDMLSPGSARQYFGSLLG